MLTETEIKEPVPVGDNPDVVLAPRHSNRTVTEKIAGVVLTPLKQTPKQWFVMAAIGFLLLQMMLGALGSLVVKGIGLWGINQPVGWGLDIINFVWWIGIGHAGTLISAILLLMRQQWRMAISRFAEAMTIFAVMCAGLYPVFHTGRPWLAYWLLPYPNSMAIWPQPRSPLVWDVFAVSTYFTVSLIFWYMGLIPDLATMRDRTKSGFAQKLYGILSLGWRGSGKHWHRYEIASLLLAGLSTPLVVSVHSIVSFDFSAGIVPGWHATIFPPYFVAGAVYAGFAMVLSLGIPIRRWYGLEEIITVRHLENMGKVMLTTGLVVAYGYAMELYFGWYSGNEFEAYTMYNKMHGPYYLIYWSLMLCNVIVPQLLWIKEFRRNTTVLFIVSMFINVGMWLERFVIIPMSLHRDFMPSSWGFYVPTIFDWGAFIGSIGFFVFNMFVFVRILPMISMFEVRTLVKQPSTGGAH